MSKALRAQLKALITDYRAQAKRYASWEFALHPFKERADAYTDVCKDLEKLLEIFCEEDD